MIEPEALVVNYREWIGVPFLHQGRTRLGCDCLGLIAGGAAELGSDVLLSHLPCNYGRDPQSQLLEGLERLTRKIELQVGAIVVLRWPQAPFASHAAIYTGSSLVHSNQPNRKVVEHTYGRQWVARTESIWAIPLVKYT